MKVACIYHAQNDMADKGGRAAGIIGVKPVPMKLFSTWEVEKTTPNCIPRYRVFVYSQFANFKLAD